MNRRFIHAHATILCLILWEISSRAKKQIRFSVSKKQDLRFQKRTLQGAKLYGILDVFVAFLNGEWMNDEIELIESELTLLFFTVGTNIQDYFCRGSLKK